MTCSCNEKPHVNERGMSVHGTPPRSRVFARQDGDLHADGRVLCKGGGSSVHVVGQSSVHVSNWSSVHVSCSESMVISGQSARSSVRGNKKGCVACVFSTHQKPEGCSSPPIVRELVRVNIEAYHPPHPPPHPASHLRG